MLEDIEKFINDDKEFVSDLKKKIDDFQEFHNKNIFVKKFIELCEKEGFELLFYKIDGDEMISDKNLKIEIYYDGNYWDEYSYDSLTLDILNNYIKDISDDIEHDDEEQQDIYRKYKKIANVLNREKKLKTII